MQKLKCKFTLKGCHNDIYNVNMLTVTKTPGKLNINAKTRIRSCTQDMFKRIE